MDPPRTRRKLHITKGWVTPILGVPLLLYWIAGWTLGFAIFLAALSALTVWALWHVLGHLARHARLRLGGHVATATVVGYRKDQDADEGAYLALVSFVARAGELRPSTPLASPYEKPPPDPERPAPPGEGRKVPPIGQTLRVVYDPRDPTWVDERLSWPWIALMATCGILAILLFGWLLIATIAVTPQVIEGTVTKH
jgi:hypothetical protein